MRARCGRCKRLPVGAQAAALSPDDRTMLAGGSDGSVRFLDLVTGDVRTASGRHDGAVVRGGLQPPTEPSRSPPAQDDRVIVWDVQHAAAGETLEGHAGQITGLAISRDSSTLYTSALDGKVLIWDLAGAHRLGRPFDVGPTTRAGTPRYALSPDGRVLAAGHGDGTVSLIDARTLRTLSTPSAWLAGRARSAAWGTCRAAGCSSSAATTASSPWSTRDRGTIVKRLPGPPARPARPGLHAQLQRRRTPHGHGDDPHDGIVRLWALPSGRPVGRPLRYPRVALQLALTAVGDVSLSPDGRTLAVTAPANRGRRDPRRSHAAAPRVAARKPRRCGTSRASHPTGASSWAAAARAGPRLWSTETWRPASRVFTGHAGRVEWAVHEPGRPHARHRRPGRHDPPVGPAHPTAARRPAARRCPTAPSLPSSRPTAPTCSPSPTPDAPTAGTCARPHGRSHACTVAGRPLTRTEWNDALPEPRLHPGLLTATAEQVGLRLRNGSRAAPGRRMRDDLHGVIAELKEHAWTVAALHKPVRLTSATRMATSRGRRCPHRQTCPRLRFAREAPV